MGKVKFDFLDKSNQTEYASHLAVIMPNFENDEAM
jgi:hypothetical protein